MITKEKYEALKAKKIEDLTNEEKEQINTYEQDINNTSSSSSGSSTSSDSSSGNIDEITKQDEKKLQEEIKKKESSATYHTKTAKDKADEDNKDSKSEEGSKSILSSFTGFLLLFGVLGSVFYFFKNKPSFGGSSYGDYSSAELEAERVEPNNKEEAELLNNANIDNKVDGAFF